MIKPLAAISAAMLISPALRGATVYHDPFRSVADTTVLIMQNENTAFEAIESRASLPKADDDRAECSYGFRWNIAGTDSTITVSLTPATDGRGLAVETPVAVIEATLMTPSGKKTLFTRRLKSNIGTGRQTNSFSVEFDRKRGVTILAGRDMLRETATLPAGYGKPASLCFYSVGPIDVDDLIYEYTTDPATALRTDWTREALEKRFARTPLPHEGFWKYLDRATDDGYARLGGEYTVGLVGDSDDGYEIIYVSGARTLRNDWECGMVKGRLRPTIFENHYDLTWYDAKMNAIDVECSATFTDDAILTLALPLLKATLRFSRILRREQEPKDK